VKKLRLVDGKPMLVIGLSERQSFGTQQNIPGQWGRFMARYHDVSNKTAEIPIGVSTNLDDEGNFDYLCGIEVSRLSELPSGLIGLKIPAQKYAVFEHAEHAAKIGATYEAIWNKWLPESGLRPANAAVIERHMPTFNPQTGLGGVEIWIPLG
jgi:AraC family transcriptional regulator